MPQPPLIENKHPVVLCDFDGTITQRDVIMMIMAEFAPPQWKDITDRILHQRTLSIREGVTQLFHLLPGSRKDDIIAFVQENVHLRQGFPEFLDFCQAQGIPFNVVSGGVDFFIEPVLAPYRDRLTLYCNVGRFHPERIDLDFPHLDTECAPCGQCACCKISIMERYPKESHYRIAVGDSLTDLAIARAADWAFARGQLVDYCREEHISITPFETFDDIRQALTERMIAYAP